MNSPTIAALIPMRHQSGRVPGKNYRPFAGKPLCHHIVETLSACPRITRVVVDTDSAVIAKEMARHFPQVVVVERPEHLRAGETPMNEVLLHTTAQVPADFYLQTHSTNPLLRAQTIDRALDAFLGQYPACDSMFSVTRLQTRLWDQLGRPVNHNPAILLRTQDLPPMFLENSNFYVFTRADLERRRNRVGERPLMFEIDRVEAWDIDEELDFVVGEFLFLRRLEHDLS
ncbi:MAG: acylneuraminate cytidylyltransferase family protein [Chloroflexi bacterium]|nr:acylneuraminate cytidylyltransferase family protein [Chloroflexota bacterium]